MFDWGDGTDSGWIGPYTSGDISNATHIWTKSGNYHVKVKAKDEFGAESYWSDPLSVSIPKNRAVSKTNSEANVYSAQTKSR